MQPPTAFPLFSRRFSLQKHSATRAISEKLFAQLDFDGSGGISFKEFLIGLEKMVMEEYGEDGDEVRRRGVWQVRGVPFVAAND